MDFDLTKEQSLIQKTAKEYAQTALAPRFDEWEEAHNVPLEIFSELGDLGLMGLPFPEQYGGSDAGFDGYVLAVEQICMANNAVGSAIIAHNLGMAIINAFGNEEQKMKFLPPAGRGEQVLSFAFTEPGTGSDPKQITCTAKKEGDYYILNGTKRFISNAQYPGTLGIVARDVDSDELGTFIVEKFCEGYSISERWEKIALNAQGLYDIYLKDCKVSTSDVLGNIGEGFFHLEAGIGYGKMGIACSAMAVAQQAYDAALEYAQQKLHRGKPITKFQAVQLLIAEMAEKIEACRLVLYKSAMIGNNSIKNPHLFAKYAALSKNFVSQNAVDVTRLAMELVASYGLMKDYKIERLYREAIVFPQVEGVPHMQQVILANYILAGI
ncbi:MAG: acyl-CoA dehydrogenase family protein [Coriobacteriia bacterium]|nr:acyl-CoA dehydrogenase family protein [Coriobacteriia bacterium]MCL2749814.1 acyl-CoA dehydrogenase family protein [Coriobacteriia bacterium]